MSLQDFMKNVVAEIADRFGNGYRVEGKDILKNNDVVTYMVIIHRQGSDTAPCIHIDDIYDLYLAGDVDISGAADRIIHSYERCTAGPEIHMLPSADRGDILSRVRGRLINTGMNRRLLEDIPHRESLDLSLVYTIAVPQHRGMAGEILIHDGHLSIWGIDETDLYNAVCRDMQAADGAVFEAMDTILGPWLGQEAGVETAGCPMYVLTNKDYRDGAVQMLNKGALDCAADRIGTDSLIILPSSIHELIILPVSDEDDLDRIHELADIVREVNDTQVERTEVLSYHVYLYNREDAEVSIAA